MPISIRLLISRLRDKPVRVRGTGKQHANHKRSYGRLIGIIGGSVLLAGCATLFDNLPQNMAVTAEFVQSAQNPRSRGGESVIALSLSGGGMRAAAFSFGVLQALTAAGSGQVDVLDDLAFMSSVSGGSLTAAYMGLYGREGLVRFREKVLDRDLERDLRLSLLWPTNLARLLAGGVNDRSNMANTLDRDIFAGATFADLFRRNKPNVWINATDLYNRTPFPFTPTVFLGMCSDLSQLRVSEAVAASMALPLAFAPVVLQTFPERCLTRLPSWVTATDAEAGSVAAGIVGAAARAMRNYRDPNRMRYIKLADGGLTDNQGLASILIARAVSGTPYGPLTAADAVRMRQMLFLIVDAGRPAGGDWASDLGGPSGFDVGLAAADAAIDSATRLSTAAFREMAQQWRADIVRYRCGLSRAAVTELIANDPTWRCDDLVFLVDTISVESLGRERADGLANVPTRLALPRAEIDASIAAGSDAAQTSLQLKRYLARREASSSILR